MTTATLAYDVHVQPTNLVGDVRSAVEGVSIAPALGALAALGVTLVSDVTTNTSSTNVRRTITLTLGAAFTAAFSSASAQKNALAKYFSQVLSRGAVVTVTSLAPVIT